MIVFWSQGWFCADESQEYVSPVTQLYALPVRIVFTER